MFKFVFEWVSKSISDVFCFIKKLRFFADTSLAAFDAVYFVLPGSMSFNLISLTTRGTFTLLSTFTALSKSIYWELFLFIL